MLRTDAGCGTVRPPEHHRRTHLTARHIQRLGGGIQNVVNGLHGEVKGHELDNGPKATECRPGGDPGKAVFGDRRVDNALGTEFFQHALRNLVGALVFTHFLAHQKHVRIAAHFLGHRFTQGFADGHGFHRRAGGPIGGLGDGGSNRSGGGGRVDDHRRGGQDGSLRGRGRISRFAVHQQCGDGGVDLDALGAGGDQQCADHTFIDGLELHRGFVGFDLGQNIAGFDGIASLDQPFG